MPLSDNEDTTVETFADGNDVIAVNDNTAYGSAMLQQYLDKLEKSLDTWRIIK